MKSLILTVVILAELCISTRADETFRGAWWITRWKQEPAAPRPAGSITIITRDSNSPVYWERVADLTLTLPDGSTTQVQGYWTDVSGSVRRIIVEQTAGNITYDGPRYVLTVKRISGQVSGTFNDKTVAGKVQATRP